MHAQNNTCKNTYFNKSGPLKKTLNMRKLYIQVYLMTIDLKKIKKFFKSIVLCIYGFLLVVFFECMHILSRNYSVLVPFAHDLHSKNKYFEKGIYNSFLDKTDQFGLFMGI